MLALLKSIHDDHSNNLISSRRLTSCLRHLGFLMYRCILLSNDLNPGSLRPAKYCLFPSHIFVEITFFRTSPIERYMFAGPSTPFPFVMIFKNINFSGNSWSPCCNSVRSHFTFRRINSLNSLARRSHGIRSELTPDECWV